MTYPLIKLSLRKEEKVFIDKTFKLKQAMTFGTAENCNVRVTGNISQNLLPVHAIFFHTGKEFWFETYAETFINDVKRPIGKWVIKSGDNIRLCQTKSYFIIEILQEAKPKPSIFIELFDTTSEESSTDEYLPK